MCPHHFLYSQNRQRLPPIFRRLFWPFRRWSEEFNPFWAYSQFPLKLQKIYKDSPAEKKSPGSTSLYNLAGGYFANSLAIMTDAAHLLSDFAGFMISLFALWVATKPATTTLSFGWHRAGTLTTFFSIRHITPATLFQRGWIWHVKSIWPPRCWMVLSDFQWFSMMLKMFDCHQALEKWSCVCSILNVLDDVESVWPIKDLWFSTDRVNRNKSN